MSKTQPWSQLHVTLSWIKIRYHLNTVWITCISGCCYFKCILRIWFFDSVKWFSYLNKMLSSNKIPVFEYIWWKISFNHNYAVNFLEEVKHTFELFSIFICELTINRKRKWTRDTKNWKKFFRKSWARDRE